MTPPIEHITVCICTFKRPRVFGELLELVAAQQTEGLFTVSIAVVDNDKAESARPTVEAFQKKHALPIEYQVEPEQNIALARNKVVSLVRGSLAAFIDDDECPPPNWLAQMYRDLMRFKCDGVLAPVNPKFEVPPARWILKARMFDRPSHPTGTVLGWTNTRTGNVLIKRSVIGLLEGPFRKEFGSGGEDRDFFRRLIEKGCVFVWTEQGAVHEVVPVGRTRRFFMLRRALIRGRVAASSSGVSPVEFIKSLGAVIGYTLCLPFLLIVGQHVFMKVLIKDCDHIGKLFGAFGIDLVKEKYLSE